MNSRRKRYLIWLLVIVAGVAMAVGLILYALKAQTDYFYSPLQVKNGEAPINKRIKIGGMVVENSLKRTASSLHVQFEVTDFKATVPVVYSNILPDLFKEKSGVVATGKLNEQGVFVASDILAKHDENYMPPDVTAMLKEQGKMQNKNAAGSK